MIEVSNTAFCCNLSVRQTTMFTNCRNLLPKWVYFSEFYGLHNHPSKLINSSNNLRYTEFKIKYHCCKGYRRRRLLSTPTCPSTKWKIPKDLSVHPSTQDSMGSQSTFSSKMDLTQNETIPETRK